MRHKLEGAFPHLAKPAAQQHAKRMDQKRKHDKPEFDPRETDRWIDKHGKFTIPHSKGERK